MDLLELLNRGTDDDDLFWQRYAALLRLREWVAEAVEVGILRAMEKLSR